MSTTVPATGQGRTAPPLRDGVFIDAQIGDGAPGGALLHQPTVRTPDGRVQRLDELCGRGFSVVARSGSELAVGAEATDVLDRLGASRVSLEGLEVVAGGFDPLFDSHAAVIVRPDRYIFGIVDSDWSLDGLLGELERKLALRPSPSHAR